MARRPSSTKKSPQHPLNVAVVRFSAPTPQPSQPAPTTVTTFDDGKFVRTALVVGGGETGSIDLVTAAGGRLAQVNVSLCDDGTLIVDTIDVDGRFEQVTGLLFDGPTTRHRTPPGGRGALVSADLRPIAAPKPEPKRAERACRVCGTIGGSAQCMASAGGQPCDLPDAEPDVVAAAKTAIEVLGVALAHLAHLPLADRDRFAADLKNRGLPTPTETAALLGEVVRSQS